MKLKQSDYLYFLALLLAIWFAFIGIIWTYNAALILGWPAGFLSFLIWLKLRKEKRQRNKLLLGVLAIASLSSIGFLIGFLVTN